MLNPRLGVGAVLLCRDPARGSQHGLGSEQGHDIYSECRVPQLLSSNAGSQVAAQSGLPDITYNKGSTMC